MKRWEQLTFVVLTIVLLLIPVYSMPFWGQSTTAEKRELAAFPPIILDGTLNTAFFDGVGDYLADRFTLRAQLVSQQSRLKGLFGVSSEEDVVWGTDDWLYFTKTMPDYTGETTITQTQTRRLRRVGELMAEYVEGQGADFALTVVPNKATIYPEHVPYYYRVGTQATPLRTLNAALADADWYVDMTAALLAESQDTLLYHKRDSHWNNLGARVGYDALMAATHGAVGAYADTPYMVQSVWDGDLDALLNPTRAYKDEQAVWQTDFTYEYTSRFRTEEDVLITTACADGQGHLVMFRDSFGNALLPLLAQQYATATFSRALPYALDLTAAETADAVIVEIVERNLANLLAAAPKMVAPSRPLPTAAVAVEAQVDGTVTTKGEYLHISGTYRGAPSVPDTVYLVVDDTAYEAFPIAEGDATEDNGFSAYLPATLTYDTITLMGECDGVWVELGRVY